MNKNHTRFVALIITVIVFIMGSIGYSADPNLSLDEKLLRINRLSSVGGDVNKLEKL
jgi:hypothetical protein